VDLSSRLAFTFDSKQHANDHKMKWKRDKALLAQQS